MSAINALGKNDDAGVEQLPPQNTDAAAAQALKEQAFGDEFKPYQPPDIDALIARLNEIDVESSRIDQKMYGPPNYYMSHNEPYKGPPYMQREQLSRQRDKLWEEKESISFKLREYVDAMGFEQTNPGPYTGTARVIE